MTRYPYPMPWSKDEANERREEVWAVKNAALREVGVPLVPHPRSGRLTTYAADNDQAAKALGVAFTSLGIDFEWLDESEYIARLVERRREKKEGGKDYGCGCLISRESWFPVELRRWEVSA